MTLRTPIVVCALAAAALAVACVAPTTSPPPLPIDLGQTFRPETEPPAQVFEVTPGAAERLLACGDGMPAFSPAVLDEPYLTGSEMDDIGAEFNYLVGGDPLAMYPDGRWRLVSRTESRVVLVGEISEGPWYLQAREANGQWFVGGGECMLRGVVDEGVGSARWWLDPRADPPTTQSTSLAVLVEESGCASGRYAMGRLVAPVVEYTDESITITTGVRALPGATCQRNQPTPAVLLLGNAIGDRQLLDGYFVSPVPAEAPAGPPPW
ncbi:MAG TPA: hypothetical protein VNW68_08770 [Candidatus Limnocylindria bacterium]|nr:hypothetical protein [Candidatus Limnocylindria bacterium]